MISLHQASADYGPQVKSGPPPGFVNKVLLEYRPAHLSMCFLWLLPCH